jgi:hypothetical protein
VLFPWVAAFSSVGVVQTRHVDGLLATTACEVRAMKETADWGVKQLLEKVDKYRSANTADWNALKDWIGALKGPEMFDQGMSVIAEWVPRVARYSFQASHIEGIRELPERVQKNIISRAIRD